MDQLLSHLSLLDNRQSEMLQQVIQLCDINSGTRNLSGLALVKEELVGLFQSLGGEIQLVDSVPENLLNNQGEQLDSQLGQSIHIVKRPNAKHKVLLCIHMDTVYQHDNLFQRCVMRDDGTLNRRWRPVHWPSKSAGKYC